MDPLADRELASGKAKPIKAPEKLIAAAVFFCHIKAISFIGVMNR